MYVATGFAEHQLYLLSAKRHIVEMTAAPNRLLCKNVIAVFDDVKKFQEVTCFECRKKFQHSQMQVSGKAVT